ncbi:transcription factor CP2-like protein 1 isoform X2 [Falco naumanni]|uniref:transcription factor CP2-like protein 1 isoform X2 n=1 Tax=Falco naumanni TaxID=148594 RepID=UPI001ADEBA58|nr:transcription factor CP2-like protein 1 isoform X2 [Falco naumanni]
MLFWHGQTDHYWSSTGEMYPIPSPGLLRDPPVLPYLKEEPNGVSTSQPPCPAFQYILCAPTSPAVRHHQETLTYLNQGQSYEIRMVGTPRVVPGGEGRRMLKPAGPDPARRAWCGWSSTTGGCSTRSSSSCRAGAGAARGSASSTSTSHSPWASWTPRPTPRCSTRRNSCGTPPGQPRSSCRFTASAPSSRCGRTGGEKGVPLRIQIDTFGVGGKGDPPEHLHSASCLVKVFKPKGADRKQKTDREKVEKQPGLEREKFQPAHESTVLSECAPWPDALGAPHSPPGTPGLPSPHPFKLLSPERGCVSPTCAAESPAESPGEVLSPCASPLETQQWLHKRRFSAYARVFASFTGADLLKLSRRDLIQICGAPDGIRLCNALAGRCPRSRLTLYVLREPTGGAEGAEEGCSGLYQEVHLEELTVAELTGKLAELLGLPVGQILRLARQGPSGIHILISDAMIRNLLDETCFMVAISKAHGPEGYHLVLR